MNINKIDQAFKSKYELYDVNHKRLIPKEIVAFRRQSCLSIGIIITVNPKTTTIVTFNDQSRYFNAKPNEQVIITSLMENKEQWFNLYDNIVNKRKQKTFLRYVPCLLVDPNKTDIERYQILVFKYQLNVGNNSKKSWMEFLNSIKTSYKFEELNLKDKELYIFGNDQHFYDIDQLTYKDINYISNNNGGLLLYQHNKIKDILNEQEYIKFPIDKDCTLYFNNSQLDSWCMNNVNYTENKKYFTPSNYLYYFNFYVKTHNKDIFNIGLNEIIKKYEH